MKNNREVAHPGEYIKDAIDELGMSQQEFGKRTDLLPKTISNLINGEANITFETASKLASFFGNSANFWINLQTKFSMYLQEKNYELQINEDWETLKLFDRKFLKAVCKTEISVSNKKEFIEELRKKLMTNSLSNLKKNDIFAFCRTSVNKDISEKNVILRNAWISYAMYLSREIECPMFDNKKLMKKIPEIKALTLSDKNEYSKELKDILGEVGIKYIELPYLKGSNISGVTRWMNNESNVIIAVNDCGKTMDKIWFNIFHELGHAVNIDKRCVTVSYTDDDGVSEEESKADQFAMDNLIPNLEYQSLISDKRININKINDFAAKIGVANYLVIGRLQKDGYIGWNNYCQYKPKHDFIYQDNEIN